MFNMICAGVCVFGVVLKYADFGTAGLAALAVVNFGYAIVAAARKN